MYFLNESYTIMDRLYSFKRYENILEIYMAVVNSVNHLNIREQKYQFNDDGAIILVIGCHIISLMTTTKL